MRLLALLTFAAVSVASCTSSGREVPTATGGAALSMDPATLTTLQFHATGSETIGYPGDASVTRVPPADTTITDPAVVRALYEYIAALPFAPPCDGCVYGCRLGFGVTYYLQFSGSAGTATFDLSFGCDEPITIEGANLFTSAYAGATYDQFLATLAQAIGTEPAKMPFAK